MIEVVAMKYLYQIALIFGFSFLGELLNHLLPWPIPASIYGMALMFLALCLGLLKLEMVKDAGNLLVSIISLLFVAPAVGMMDQWTVIAPKLVPIVLIVLSSTFLTFAVSGIVTQKAMKKGDTEDDSVS